MRTLFVALLLAVPLAAQERTHTVVPDDYFTLNTITEIAVSPDGKHVAYALAVWDKAEDNRKSDLWVIGTVDKEKPTKLTFDRANDRHPKWSADGKHLYFLGNRKKAAETKPPFDGTTQIWRVAADGTGEVHPITREVGGVSGYDYAAKADALFFSKDKEHADDDEFAKLRAKAKLEYGHGVRKVSEIHKLDVRTREKQKLVDDTRYVRSFAVTQDGKKIALVSAFDDSVVKSEGESRVDVWSQEDGRIHTPPTDAYRKNPKNSPYAWLENLSWNPEGSFLAFTAVHDAYPAEVVVISHPTSDEPKVSLVNRQYTKLEVANDSSLTEWHVAGYGRGINSVLQWSQTQLETLYVLTETRAGTEVRVVDTGFDRNQPLLREFWHNINGFHFAGGAPFLAVVRAGRDSFPEIRGYTLEHKKSPSVNSLYYDPNPHTRNWRGLATSVFSCKAPDGTRVSGVVEFPPNSGWKRKLPLIVAIHGGPTTSTKMEASFDPHNGRLYLSSAGYMVLLPNYRGSTGSGDKFVTDLIGRENDIEVKDILALIQGMIDEGHVDPERIGVMGWSNGGYLTNCLITLKDSPVKFKAASSGAGIVDTVAEWGFNDEPAYPIVFKKGLPWEQPEIYKNTSPTYQLGNVKTPTLIHVGGGDERCPPGHSRMLYRALKENLKVPTELIVYPGEPHGLTKMSNRKAKMEWDLAWFDKYLKNGGK